MKLALVFVGSLLMTGVVSAQYQPMPVQNPRAQPNTQRVVKPVASPVAETAVIDEHAMNQRLREKINALQRENAALRARNESLKSRLTEYTSKTGSEVHAYCENSSISRNTAGAQTDCNRSGYVCEEVSGMCKTSCQTTDMCAPSWVCDTGIEQCVPAGGG
jgi:regulator of replication initiation timing